METALGLLVLLARVRRSLVVIPEAFLCFAVAGIIAVLT